MGTLPDKVIVTLADQGPDGERVYRIEDKRGYTHSRETIRIGSGLRSDWYRISILRRDGWTQLLDGAREPNRRSHEYPYDAAILRAVAVLFGMEDHG